MYYPELLEVIRKTGAKEAIEKLDKYFAFLPNRTEKIVTISNIASMLELDYSMIRVLMGYIYELGILDKVYIINCPECGREILIASQKSLLEKVKELDYCIKCRHEIEIESSDVVVGYKVIKKPDIDSSDIVTETQRLFEGEKIDYSDEDILKKLFEENKENPHDFFYNPSNEDRELMKKLYDSLDEEFANNKTKGDSLEGLIKLLFNSCAGMTASNEVRTTTNQIDCTVRNDYFIPLSVYKELGSIIKAEGKNEPENRPGNSYYHKLYGILNTSKSTQEQSIGILFSRLSIASTCFDLARQYFLKDKIIIINIDDNDLHRIVYDEENFLDVIQEKIQQVKNNIKTKPEKHMLYRKRKE
ncbi:hypothetical protein [Clostridium perfringens]|uniref:hypothetical protein n=1 Tax=Clostridium perfringens TaxID=1502 RepID=UPI00399CEA14